MGKLRAEFPAVQNACNLILHLVPSVGSFVSPLKQSIVVRFCVSCVGSDGEPNGLLIEFFGRGASAHSAAVLSRTPRQRGIARRQVGEVIEISTVKAGGLLLPVQKDPGMTGRVHSARLKAGTSTT